MSQSSLETTDAQAKAVQKTPNRISLDELKSNIKQTEYINPPQMPHVTIAVMELNNGYVVSGLSAPADPENFNADLGKQFAYEDAARQVWPLLGFRLRDQMTPQETFPVPQTAGNGVTGE